MLHFLVLLFEHASLKKTAAAAAVAVGLDAGSEAKAVSVYFVAASTCVVGLFILKRFVCFCVC